MNRLPYATTLISACAAVILWLIAMYLEGNAPWQPTEPRQVTSTDVAAVREDSPLRNDSRIAGCEDSEAALEELVASSQYCAADEDCTLFDYGYPIECLTSVAKSEISALRLEYREFVETCEYRVYYDCPTGHMERQAVCRDNRCAVELIDNELLEDETLDYLGIDQ